MASLAELTAAVPGARLVTGDPARSVTGVRDDSRAVTPGDLFVAVPGTKADGRRFVSAALAAGAVAVAIEAPLPAEASRTDRVGAEAGPRPGPPSRSACLGWTAAPSRGARDPVRVPN